MGRVAPHQNREVLMVMNGLKPFATVEFDKDSDSYAMAVSLCSTGMLIGTVRPTEDCDMGEIAFTKPANRHLIGEYNTLLSNGIAMLGVKGYHRAMGKLFGYAEEDVEAFIAANIQCDCVKCTGRQRQ